MTPYWLAAIVVGVAAFGVTWKWFICGLLAEVECERTDLAHAASPCTQTLRRYQR